MMAQRRHQRSRRAPAFPLGGEGSRGRPQGFGTMQTQDGLKEGLRATAFAFRGYNVTNLGRTPELLAHPSYGPTVSAVLGEASQTCSEVLGRQVDLLARVRSGKETTDLTTYAEDMA